jgi:hypothetical protein
LISEKQSKLNIDKRKQLLKLQHANWRAQARDSEQAPPRSEGIVPSMRAARERSGGTARRASGVLNYDR